MINEDILNKVNTLMGANDMGETTTALWRGVSEKAVDGVKAILAPLSGVIMDIQTDFIVSNPDALPTVQVEVISDMGDALIDETDWNKSDIHNKYVDVKLHRVSRPYTLSVYEIANGGRVESKTISAQSTVANGVMGLFNQTITDAAITADTISDFGPEKVAELSAAFGKKSTHTLIVSPAAYAKLIPTSGFAVDPAKEGAYGIAHIIKSAVMPANVDIIALTADAVCGAIVTPEIHSGDGLTVRQLGTINDCPMVLKAQRDFNETYRASVESMAGFTVTDKKFIKTYKLG